MGIFPYAQGQITHTVSPWPDRAGFQTQPSFYGCTPYIKE